jgi:subtilisin family serine protease
LVVASSGNDGPDKNTVEDPGVCLGVVSVGAVDRTGTVASFSSRHPYLTITAPGVAIASLSRTVGAAYSGDGTSQATAIASAAIALVWSKYPTLSNRQVLARVLATLDRKSATRDPAYGYGTLNAYRAVTANVPADSPNPVFTAAAPFIARARAFSSPAPKPPAPAVTGTHSTGRFSIGSSPRLKTPMVLWGLGTAGVGVIALVGIVLAAWLGRRRRVPTPADVVALPEQRTGPVFWHEVSAPNAADPPTEWWTGPER